MLVVKWSVGESEESIAHILGSTQQRDSPGLETQGRHYQKSLKVISVAQQKRTDVLQEF